MEFQAVAYILQMVSVISKYPFVDFEMNELMLAQGTR